MPTAEGYREDEIREEPRVFESPVTGNRYIAERWVPQGDGKFVSIEKRKVPQSDKSRPMIFAVTPAFRQLADKGVVLSMRAELKPEGPVWVRTSRTGKKRFDATRRLVGVLNSENRLRSFAEENHGK